MEDKTLLISYPHVHIWVRWLKSKIKSLAILPINPLYSPLLYDGGFTDRFLEDIIEDIGNMYSITSEEKQNLYLQIFKTGE